MTDYAVGPAHRLRHHAEADLDTWFPVTFYERKIVSEDPIHRYRYEGIDVRTNQMAGNRGYPMNFPPAVGDWMIVGDVGSVKVIDRQWLTSGYGSVYWPLTEDRPIVPHQLILIVERADGPFLWEAELEEEDGDG